MSLAVWLHHILSVSRHAWHIRCLHIVSFFISRYADSYFESKDTHCLLLYLQIWSHSLPPFMLSHSLPPAMLSHSSSLTKLTVSCFTTSQVVLLCIQPHSLSHSFTPNMLSHCLPQFILTVSLFTSNPIVSLCLQPHSLSHYLRPCCLTLSPTTLSVSHWVSNHTHCLTLSHQPCCLNLSPTTLCLMLNPQPWFTQRPTHCIQSQYLTLCLQLHRLNLFLLPCYLTLCLQSCCFTVYGHTVSLSVSSYAVSLSVSSHAVLLFLPVFRSASSVPQHRGSGRRTLLLLAEWVFWFMLGDCCWHQGTLREIIKIPIYKGSNAGDDTVTELSIMCVHTHTQTHRVGHRELWLQFRAVPRLKG